MKTRLPKVLMAALLAAYTLSGIPANAEYTYTGETTITGTYRTDDWIIVEGKLHVGDGTTETDFSIGGREISGSDTDSFIIEGSDARVYLNKATISSIHAHAQLWIGYTTDSGKMIVDNNSTVDIRSATTLGLHGADSELTITNNSTFYGGYTNLWMEEGTINVAEHSRLEVCTDNAPDSWYNYRAITGMAWNGGTSNINVSGGSSFLSSASQFITNFYDNTIVNINVDGIGSSFIQTEKTQTRNAHVVGSSGEWVYREKGVDGWAKETGWYDKETPAVKTSDSNPGNTITYICHTGTDEFGKLFGDTFNCTTNISATNGGTIEFNSVLAYIGSFHDFEEYNTKKKANFTVGAGSSISFNRLEIYADTEITNEGKFAVNGNMALHAGAKLILNVTEANTTHEVITLGNNANFLTPDSEASNDSRARVPEQATITINMVETENKKAGSKYVLFNKAVDLSGAKITGDNVNVTIVNGETVITLLEDIFVARDPLADVLGAAAWGVQKSSQAFTGTLWGGRTNAVVLNTTYDDKGGALPVSRTIAWGTAYGQFSEIDSCGEATGADYSIYGAAIGAEHQFTSGRSIGAALGYDWGKVSPFHSTSIDQESMHAAVYGRAGQWKLGTRGVLALDLSAAVGQTESELPVGDVEQDSLQLDARVSYIRSISDKTSVSAFAGLQYYAQSDDTTANVEVGSAQYLRTLAGVGINHAVTDKTTVFAEASVYNDAMRHNPEVMVDGFSYGVANPGRLGGTITAGAAYELNANWTLRGSYSFDTASQSTEHSVNAGAVYKF